MRGVPVVVLGIVLALAGCGAPPPEPPLNAGDVMFVQMMVQHHRQGIEIARLGAERAGSPEVRTLTAAIEATQQDEVEMMLRWLHDWEQPLRAGEGAHDHHGGMPETDVRRIRALRKSKDFERDLLVLLIAHQGDAVRMAQAEVAGGVNPAARAWAGQVESSRRGQVELMTQLATKLVKG
ncbi:hypothetical protein Nocox_41170 [Nonomuraea coxensis DSM 45129]|uniref:DUF305 domain-containing protein n=1 Tax=Nonomuraea coxensis DSM 45129 TaxID=1122611 RepID=A0ABX8UHU5_9ACTN|nr:DUF305 domain-containing protein [Nonomuraea coxensis]QYC45777.1 hypothetical protein Nocox_41170 [Nonomuraea coxensis DSM 45129]